MSLIYGAGLDASQEGPGTHVLIIGVGAQRSTNAVRREAVDAAVGFAEWLIEHYRNPSAPLASVRMLAYPASGEIVRLKSLSTFSKVAAPSFANACKALDEWAEASRRNAENVAILYYAGYSVEDGFDTGLLLTTPRGEKGKNRYISAENIRSALRGTGTAHQLFLFDVERLTFAGMPPVEAPLAIPVSMADTPVQTAIYASAPVPFGRPRMPGEGTPFFRALVQGLEETPPNGRGAISSHALASWLQKGFVAERGRDATAVIPRIQLEGDFDIHFPGAPPDRASSRHPAIRGVLEAIEEGEDLMTARGESDGASARVKKEANTDFVSDDAETGEDHLDRAVLAIGLARRLHRIWCRANAAGNAGSTSFVMHLDAPWGGGKTSFANFLGSVLNPVPRHRPSAKFLRDRYPGKDIGGVFLDEPPTSREERERLFAATEDERRPWIVVPFNAWLNEHCSPPWWTFFQTIRRYCFAAITSEGTHPWCGNLKPDGREWFLRKGHWARLSLGEIWWRLNNPKIRTLLLTAAFSALGLAALSYMGALDIGADPAKPAIGFALKDALGYMLAGVAGITGIWGLGALLTESVLPGTDTLAERLSLGKGDPFERFRAHFDRTMRAVRRPVLVVVDDLDRCNPAFVVDLIRGIQTVLVSPRVVFIILGDRDWIESAFEAHHKAMAGVDVGPEQRFGARFVEKAIQMSFTLPALDAEAQRAYVRRVLFAGTEKGSNEAAALGQEEIERIRAAAVASALASDGAPLDVGPLVEAALADLEQDGRQGPINEAVRTQMIDAVSEALAMNAAVDERVEAAVVHELEPLAALLPANPRQIKRIVNAVTIYWAVAIQRLGVEADAMFRFQLARWVAIMTEWPESWRSLNDCPALADCLTASDPMEALEKIDPEMLPDGVVAARGELARMLADQKLVRLVAGNSDMRHASLTAQAINRLAMLIPARPRRRAKLSETALSTDH